MARIPLILQAEAAECGLACLAMISSYHGGRTDLNALRRRYPVSINGVTLRTLMQVGNHMGLTGRGLRVTTATISQLRLPAILHWDMSHFVVLKSVSKTSIVVLDPASGERRLTREEAANHLTGVAVEITPNTQFTRKDERTRLSFAAFLGGFQHSHALAQVLVLSLTLEVLVVAAPLYMQLTMDQVIAMGDTDLLIVLAFGFGLLAAIQVGVTALRSLILLVLQNTLHFEIGARLFHHLIRLPLTYFEKRHIGDVLSRFSSIEPIRNMIAEGMIAASVDGMMALATAAMIFFYSPQLGFIVLATFAIYATARILLFRLFWRRSEETIRTKARQDTSFVETMRAMQSIKLFNREEDREGQWLNGYAAFVHSNVQLGRVKIGFAAINDVLFAAENIVSVYLAARLALSGALTVGMIFALMSYKRNFTDKAALLVEKAIDFRIIGLHLERLSDIAMADLERGHDLPLSYARKIDGRIELRDVCFRYAEGEPYVLEHVNLIIEAGQFVTIMGSSGGGKTTLVKIMLGLLEPTSGEVLIDNVALAAVGYRAYREQIAAVMQEDQLLSGSLADNICFFESAFDQNKMISAAQIACVDDEIMRMPMAYNSLIGDMGSSLSGGQKQRVLLARALYRDPRILFLDEGTAHLNVEIERAINQNLRKLQITRVSIAHRPEMMSGADVVLQVADRSARTSLHHD